MAGITEQIKITHKRGNKTIEEIRPKYAWITSHTCRRSFCTNEYLAGTPSDLIMTISGHKTEKAFRKYIKADKVQKAPSEYRFNNEVLKIQKGILTLIR